MQEDGDDGELVIKRREPLKITSPNYLGMSYVALGTPAYSARPVVYPSSYPDITTYDFHPCLSYIRTDLFSSYDSWRYKHVYERWQIGIRV